MGLTRYDILNKQRIKFNRTEGYCTINGYKVRETQNKDADRAVALKLDKLQKKIDKMIQMYSSPGHLRTDPKINIIMKVGLLGQQLLIKMEVLYLQVRQNMILKEIV